MTNPIIWFGSPCCCNKDCSIYADNFNRPDSGSLGSAWTEDAGTWSIEDETLKTSSSDAFAYYNTALNDPAYVSYVPAGLSALVKIKATDDGAIAGINAYLLTYGYDLTVEIEFGAAAKVRLWRESTLLLECDVTAPVDTWVELRVDYNQIVDDFVTVWVDDELIGTRYVLSTGYIYSEQIGPFTATITGDVFFEDFKIKENSSYYYYPVKPECALEASPCYWPMVPVEEDLPNTITAVIADVGFDGTFDRSPLNGTYVLERVAETCEYALDIHVNLDPPNERFYYSRLWFRHDVHNTYFVFTADFDDELEEYSYSGDFWRIYIDETDCGEFDLVGLPANHWPFPPNPGTVTLSP